MIIGVEDLAIIVYVLFGICIFGIILLTISTVFLYWKVTKLSQRNGPNRPREADNSREVGLQLVSDRFQIPKPNLKKPWDEFEANNAPRNNFGADNRAFNRAPEERVSNTNGMPDRNQFLGLNDIDTISDSNFSFGRPGNNFRSEPRGKGHQEDRKPAGSMQGTDSGLSFSGQIDDYFSLPLHGGAQYDPRNKRDQTERGPFAYNSRSSNSFRNPLSGQNDAMSDNVPHSQQRNLHRNVNY